MTRDFKKQLNEQKAAAPRVAIPQVDPGAPKPTPASVSPAGTVDQSRQEPPAVPVEPAASPEPVPVRLAAVDTSEAPVNRGFHMYPSRHKQLRDLAYNEERKPWQIVEDALEEYVTKHYGKQHKRK